MSETDMRGRFVLARALAHTVAERDSLARDLLAERAAHRRTALHLLQMEHMLDQARGEVGGTTARDLRARMTQAEQRADAAERAAEHLRAQLASRRGPDVLGATQELLAEFGGLHRMREHFRALAAVSAGATKQGALRALDALGRIERAQEAAAVAVGGGR